MSIQEAYAHWSATYDSDRNLTRDLDQAVTRNALEHLRCASILELGCGTGENTSLLARIGDRVHALDFSEGMIAQAQMKLHAENVTFTVADLARPWPFAEQSFDLIVCNLVLEHVQTLSFIFAEAFRVLVEHGRFFACELHPFRQYQGKKAVFHRDEERIEIAAFVHHISDFLNAAEEHKLTLKSLKEWWHEEDQKIFPRLVSFLFER